jgi:hypothetical protein
MTSALDTLKRLASKKTVDGQAASALTVQLQDPALAGARRDKNVVRLGFDPAMAEKAQTAAELKAALQEAEARFSMIQSDMRQYGADKRELYNDTFKCDVTTVSVPYSVEVPGDPAARETRYVSVVCTNRYTVARDAALGMLQAQVLDQATFDRLFVVETAKRLKANAEELVRGLLGELGMVGDDLENAMQTLFDTETKVSASKDYERRIKEVDDNTRALLAQAVKRVEPALKFG